MPIGIRFKTAMNALKKAVTTATTTKGEGGEDEGCTKVNARANMQKIMFVKGPAMLVFPMVSLLAVPPIITAPGAIILKNGEMMDMSVMTAPIRVSLNSAHKP
jgi:hypothetical protein